MATGIIRSIFDVWHGTEDQVSLGFLLSSEDGSFAGRTLKDFSRAAAFMESEPEDLRRVTEEYLKQFKGMTHEERRDHQSHYMASIRASDGCGTFHDADKTIEEFADWMHDHMLNEPGNIMRSMEKQRSDEAERQRKWDEWRAGDCKGTPPW